MKVVFIKVVFTLPVVIARKDKLLHEVVVGAAWEEVPILSPTEARGSLACPRQCHPSCPAGRPHTRCTAITAAKYLISDQPHPIDPLLKTFIGEHPLPSAH